MIRTRINMILLHILYDPDSHQIPIIAIRICIKMIRLLIIIMIQILLTDLYKRLCVW